MHKFNYEAEKVVSRINTILEIILVSEFSNRKERYQKHGYLTRGGPEVEDSEFGDL